MHAPGFFDHEDQPAKLEKLVYPLPRLDSIVDWAPFRPLLKAGLPEAAQEQCRTKAARRHADVQDAGAAGDDDQAEFQIGDRVSFQRFWGLSPEDTLPDAKRLRLFREQLARHGLIDKLFRRFDEQL